jgi:hypothetical protein
MNPIQHQQELDCQTITDPVSGKTKRILMSDGARIRIMKIFDKEIIKAHEAEDEKLRKALCRLKGAILQC